MAKRLNMQKVMKLRYDYFLDVYKKYIYNVFTELNRPKNEQIILGMIEHNEKNQILETYMKNKSLSEPQKKVMEEWKHEIFGMMHIIYFNQNQVFIYCEETNQVYHPYLLDSQIKKQLKHIPIYIRTQATLFTVYGKLYLDNVLNIQSDSDDSLQTCEDLYEHIYNILSKKPEYLLTCMIYSRRSLETDQLSRIFMDYMGPLCPSTMSIDELETFVETAIMVWNSELVEEIDISPIKDDYVVQFLRNRKRKYFREIKRVIVDYWIDYDYDGFQINLASHDC